MFLFMPFLLSFPIVCLRYIHGSFVHSWLHGHFWCASWWQHQRCLVFVKGWVALDLWTAANAKYGVRMATPVTRYGSRKNLMVDLMQDYILCVLYKYYVSEAQLIFAVIWEIDWIFLWRLSRVCCQTKLAQIWFYWYGLELFSDYLLCKTEV